MKERITKALVTGTSSGIGQAIAVMLLKHGITVYGIGMSTSARIRELEHTFKDTFHHTELDITDTSALKKYVSDINRDHDTDLLVNCAGCAWYGLHEDIGYDHISRIIRTDLEAPALLMNLLLRDLKKNRGAVVNISSVTADEVCPHGAVYGAAKAGLTSLSHSIEAEGRKHGLRVINIEPDMTESGLYRNADFTADTESDARLEPDDTAGALEYALFDTREGMYISDIRLKPQIHRISRRK